MPNHIDNPCSILADPNGGAWEFAKKIYENLCKRNGTFELNEISIKEFRDHEIKVKIKENIRRKNCFFIHDSSLKPADWFLQLALVNEAVHSSSANELIDVLPYMKFSRQDRKDESRVAVNARAVSDILSLYTNRILTIDTHSSLLPSFYRIPFDNLYSSRMLYEYLKKNHPTLLENAIIMSPDAGGTSRAKGFATKLGIENIVIGYKYRKKEGEIHEFKVVGEVKGENVLIIDDMVDSGGTIIEAVKGVRAMGAKRVYVYCTHGLFSSGRENIARVVDGMFVTNSIPQQPSGNVEVIPLENLFAEAIYRTNEGSSLSQLFE
ncbi:MAG: ribose-phosphate diphosphokinase [Candidatus Diapherotrites archaeon]